MIRTIIAISLLLLLVVGCGVDKTYVAEQITASEARTGNQIGAVEGKADANAAELASLKGLAAELQSKTDMALNEAKGFENYQIIWEGEVNFDYDSYDISDVALQTLNEAGEKMNGNPGSLLEIVGHTDVSGSKKYNLLLGEKRASSTRRYLADNYGVSLYRMFVLSYGENKPVALPDENNSNSRNRRVKLTVWGSM